MPLRVSLFSSQTDTDPIPHSVEWDELREALAVHQEVDSKEGVALLCPAAFLPDTTRAKRNVAEVSLGILDVDDGLSLDDALAMLRTAGVEAIVYTSHSHTPEEPRFRVVIPLARPVPAHMWPRVWPRLTRILDHHVDPKCKDASRIYYVPACPPGAPREVHHVAGAALDLLEGLVVTAPPPVPEGPIVPPEAREMPLEELRALAKDTTSEELATILAGATFPAGERRPRIHKAMGALVFRVPEVGPKVALDLFMPSVEAMNAATPEKPIPLADLVKSYERARQAWAEQKAERDAILGALRRSTVAPDPVDPLAVPSSEPYTEEQLAAIAAREGCDVQELHRRWIVQRGDSFYVLGPAGYLPPIVGKELPASLPRDLARAPVELWHLNTKGEVRPTQPTDVLREYATVARRVVASLSARRSHYDARTQTFVEAVCPLRPITPKEHPEIQRWLELLGGNHAGKLLDWVATVTNLDRQSCAIYLAGAGGVGKSLLGVGLARLWTIGGPTKAAQVLSADFNQALASCPLIVADEALPKRAGQRQTSAELRELIGSSVRPLKRKFLPDSEMLGAVRLILAANNDRLLDLGEDLDPADQAAVAERFLIIHPDARASEYLISIGGPPVVDRWITQDRIAEHALWLRDTRRVESGGRWLVRGEAEAVHRRLAVSSGVAGGVVEWVARHLAEPRKVAPRVVKGEPPGVLVGNGEICVSPTFIADAWEVYCPAERRPTLHAVGKACRSLATGDKVQRRTDGLRGWYWPLQVEAILTWAEANVVGDPETLRARVAAVRKEAA